MGTPERVVRSYEEFCAGYRIDPVALLERTFEETDGYDEIVLLRDIRLESYCEHHMVPIIGRAHVAYLPHRRVVGISKLARVVDAYAKRLQIQEKLTAQIANTINEVLQPRGVAVIIEAAAPVHDHPRHPQARGVDGHQPHARRLPRRPEHAARTARHDRPIHGDRHRLKPGTRKASGVRVALDGVVTPADGLNGDIHGSAEYRVHLIGVMARRAVAAAG